jgi:hypothetical protein
MQMVIIRVPKDLLEAFDKTCQKGERAEKIRDMMRKEAANYNGQAPPVSYAKLKAQANKYRQEMEQLKKNPNLDTVADRVLKEEQLQVSWIPRLIKDLLNYRPQPGDEFNRYDVEDFISYLEARLKLEKVLQQIKHHRAIKYGKQETEQQNDKVKEKEYIPPFDLCDSGCGLYETKAEHDAREQKELEEREREEEEEQAKRDAEHSEDDDDEEEEDDEYFPEKYY